jgi:heme exporter protein A
MNARLSASGIRKIFNRRTIFRDVAFDIMSGQTLLISGRNGSGKSTLVKIIAGVLSPTEGQVSLACGGIEGTGGNGLHLGLVAPYLQLYEEFTARENLELGLSLRGLAKRPGRADELLDRVGLGLRKDDTVRTFSSGMKQRVKYALALMHDPTVLILDEPMANLDSDGMSVVREVMAAQRGRGILVVATNDLHDVQSYDHQVDLNASR